MATSLMIDERLQSFPAEIDNLESLLRHAKKCSEKKQQVIVEVRVDGKCYSEEYAHQAEEVGLDSVQVVKVTTCTAAEFAEGFLSRMPDFIAQVREGFQVSAELLRDPEKEEDGNDILARSLEALKDVKAHHDNACKLLEQEAVGLPDPKFWEGLSRIAEDFISAQEEMDAVLMADLLEQQVIPHMEICCGTE